MCKTSYELSHGGVTRRVLPRSRSKMNSGMAYAHESHFGPPSKPVSIAGFIQALEEVNIEIGTTSSSQDFYAAGESMITQAWNTLHGDVQEAASSECALSSRKKVPYSSMVEVQVA
jgi:hypothetical protein